jgi:hypothetical protein
VPRSQPARHNPPAVASTGGAVASLTPTQIALKQKVAANVWRRVAASQLPALCAAADETPPRTVEDDMNAALGCKTSDVALALLAQIVGLEHASLTTAEDATVDRLLASATASLAELEPKTATEAMLAVQMIGAQRTALKFLERATLPGQTADGMDANVLRATRLMRLFNEQVETMAKLKGKGGQQRVVVEHVTVAAGARPLSGA